MKRIVFFFITFFCAIISAFTQVKIGENPASIHPSSILELESSNRALVISRMSNTQMNAITPLRGALIYNIDQNCVFLYDGSIWINLCDSGTDVSVTTSGTAPTNNNIGDFWINDTQNNTTSIWDGTNWVSIDNNPRRGNGIPSVTTVPNPAAGDIYVDSTTGAIYAYDGTTWVNSNASYTANNGLLIDANNTIQLGGVLIQPTIIETNATNTLAITGLEEGDATTDDVITVDRATGVLKKAPITNFLREDIIELTAQDGQVTFTGLTLYTTNKINVFRNGVRIDFTVDNATTITIEPDATCYAGDEIRIVQLY